jgi:hypothetical protein
MIFAVFVAGVAYCHLAVNAAAVADSDEPTITDEELLAMSLEPIESLFPEARQRRQAPPDHTTVRCTVACMSQGHIKGGYCHYREGYTVSQSCPANFVCVCK